MQDPPLQGQTQFRIPANPDWMGAALKSCVLDAACVLSWLLPDESSEDGEKVLAAYEAGNLEFHVPYLWSSEVVNALVVAHRRKRITLDGLLEALEILREIRWEYHEETTPASRFRIVKPALQHGLTAYDAAYLELAQRLCSPLYSRDAELLKAAVNEGVETVFKPPKTPQQ